MFPRPHNIYDETMLEKSNNIIIENMWCDLFANM